MLKNNLPKLGKRWAKILQTHCLIAVLLVAGLVIINTSNISHADVPLAARLLAEPYESTGVRVTISNFGSMYGLATDGTNAYAIDSSGNVYSVPLANLAALAGGSSTSTDGTLHTVGWGSGGAPSWPGSAELSLAYSNGCLFITNNNNTEGSIHLYCIDVSDYTVTDIPISADKPLPEGYYYVKSSLIDFPDGRIGKVSKEYADGAGEYYSYLRTYTLTGTGKTVSTTWSEDFIMNDPTNFATDEHGIATDGTYLYRIQWRDYNPNTKVWSLSSGTTSTVVYSGQYTMPFDNMHFIAHNHTDSYYLVGHYSSNHFFITTAADPGPGPGHGLNPAFTTATSTSGGFTSQITNYDGTFTWSAAATTGTVSLSGSGLVTVTGLAEATSATVYVTTTKSGYPAASRSVTGTSLDITAPTITALASSTTSTIATITWSTDETASTKVYFGSTAAYTTSSLLADTSPRVTNHSAVLTSLPTCTTYHFAAVSSDAAGNFTTSTDTTFTTTGCVASSTPLSSTSTAITVSSGGSLAVTTNAGNTLTVTTPVNVTATSTSLVIQVQQIDKETILSSLGRPTSVPQEVGSVVFDVKAIIDNTTILDSFDQAVTISYQYGDSDVSSIRESSLWLYHYHNSEWTALDSCTVNTSNNTISCTTPSFSIFALFGQAQTSGGGINYSSGGGSMSAPTSAPAPVQTSTTTHIPLADVHSEPVQQSMEPITASPAKEVAKTTASEKPSKMAASTICTYTTTLRYGDKGTAVINLQKFLTTMGKEIYPEGKINGVFGPATRSAVIRFQEKYAADVLKPWGLTRGTAYVYKTTKAKMCELAKNLEIQKRK